MEEAIQGLDPLCPIPAVAAGRTDAGVHAAGQVVHFDTFGPIPSERWASALNGRLPKTIRVLEAVDRPSSWHACYSAIYRRYRYTIYNGKTPNLFLAPWCWHRYHVKLDDDVMRLALEGLIGHHDFSAFQRSGSNRPNALTTIQEVEIHRRGDLLDLEVQATGFLYGMVRLLVGQLVALGEHRLDLLTFEKRWRNRSRNEVKESAPANGLCLIRVGYQDPIFKSPLCFDSFPRSSLFSSDPPKPPIRLDYDGWNNHC